MKRTLLILVFIGLLADVHLFTYINEHDKEVSADSPKLPTFKFPPSNVDEELDQIVGGVSANIKDYPYMAALFLNGSLCGGTLFKGSYILTAAHCIYGKSASAIPYFTILFNSTSLNGSPGYFLRGVRAFAYHPSYNPSSKDNDVALLALSSPVTTLPSVTLPQAGATTCYIGNTATIIGWGTTSSGGSISTNLLQANVTTLDNDACAAKYGSGINNLKICAAAPGKDTCQGDSGGPLLVDGVQAGITSYGIGCADSRYPGVYARVTTLNGWITSTVATL